MASRKRSLDWEDDEITVLLEVAIEMRLYRSLDGKKRRHKNVSITWHADTENQHCVFGNIVHTHSNPRTAGS